MQEAWSRQTATMTAALTSGRNRACRGGTAICCAALINPRETF